MVCISPCFKVVHNRTESAPFKTYKVTHCETRIHSLCTKVYILNPMLLQIINWISYIVLSDLGMMSSYMYQMATTILSPFHLSLLLPCAYLPLPPILCRLVFHDSFDTGLGANIQVCNHQPSVYFYPNDHAVAHVSCHRICQAGT